MVRDVRSGGAGQSATAGVWREPQARYLPIADHGLIGDLHTAALVGADGTIDWYCCPRFDSQSIFAAILDADHGGHAHPPEARRPWGGLRHHRFYPACPPVELWWRESIFEMALVVGALKPPLQVVDARRHHHHQHGGREGDNDVHNLCISRAMRASSRNR